MSRNNSLCSGPRTTDFTCTGHHTYTSIHRRRRSGYLYNYPDFSGFFDRHAGSANVDPSGHANPIQDADNCSRRYADDHPDSIRNGDRNRHQHANGNSDSYADPNDNHDRYADGLRHTYGDFNADRNVRTNEYADVNEYTPSHQHANGGSDRYADSHQYADYYHSHANPISNPVIRYKNIW